MLKEKTEGLTPEEKVEQAKLREEYIEGYRRSVRHHIEGIKIVDEEGNDVTPENYVRYNVKKVYMAVVLMTQIHNNTLRNKFKPGRFHLAVLKYSLRLASSLLFDFH